MKLLGHGLALCAIVALSACGGGGGSSGGGTGTAPAPAPTPTPTPSPTPVAATARVFGASAMTGRLDFSNSRDINDGAVQGFVARDGFYYPSYLNAIVGYSAAGTGGNAAGDNSAKFKRAFVIDHESALTVTLSAPDSVKMITPVTALLFQPGSDQVKLKTQLGIAGSLFGMNTVPDLASYDAISEAASGDAARSADAARMAAASLRALAIGAAVNAMLYRSAPEQAGSDIDLGANLGFGVSTCLIAAPGEFLFTNVRMTEVVKCGAGPQTLRPATYQAVAHLIDIYAAAIPVRVETAGDRARWMLGLRGYLAPAVAQLVAADSDAAAQAVLALGTQTVLDETARYVDHYSYNATGLFFPGPDFLTIPSGNALGVTTAKLQQNDTQWGVGGNGGIAPGGTIQSVSVPAASSGQVTAVLSGSAVTVTVAAGFRGVTYFDYVTRSSAGEDRSMRVYVRAY